MALAFIDYNSPIRNRFFFRTYGASYDFFNLVLPTLSRYGAYVLLTSDVEALAGDMPQIGSHRVH